jgi:WD40 repeat protein
VTLNQDTTYCLWDIQNLASSLAFLKGYIGAIHSLCFTSKGYFLAMAELADLKHVFDTKHDYAK